MTTRQVSHALAKSPSGIVHSVTVSQVSSRIASVTTACGTKAEWRTWERLSRSDDLERLQRCQRCFR